MLRVYVDTSVFGGTQDEEFAEPSRRFLERVGSGKFLLLVSAEVVRELQDAPGNVQDALADIPEDCLEEAPVNPEVKALAAAYVAAGILEESSLSDAVHVAAGTVAGADLIVSWNFKHIVNYERIRKYNAVNVLNNYRPIEIRSPSEVAYGQQD